MLLGTVFFVIYLGGALCFLLSLACIFLSPGSIRPEEEDDSKKGDGDVDRKDYIDRSGIEHDKRMWLDRGPYFGW